MRPKNTRACSRFPLTTRTRSPKERERKRGVEMKNVPETRTPGHGAIGSPVTTACGLSIRWRLEQRKIKRNKSQKKKTKRSDAGKVPGFYAGLLAGLSLLPPPRHKNARGVVPGRLRASASLHTVACMDHPPCAQLSARTSVRQPFPWTRLPTPSLLRATPRAQVLAGVLVHPPPCGHLAVSGYLWAFRWVHVATGVSMHPPASPCASPCTKVRAAIAPRVSLGLHPNPQERCG
jgi:hypothetical protein